MSDNHNKWFKDRHRQASFHEWPHNVLSFILGQGSLTILSIISHKAQWEIAVRIAEHKHVWLAICFPNPPFLFCHHWREEPVWFWLARLKSLPNLPFLWERPPRLQQQCWICPPRLCGPTASLPAGIPGPLKWCSRFIWSHRSSLELLIMFDLPLPSHWGDGGRSGLHGWWPAGGGHQQPGKEWLLNPNAIGDQSWNNFAGGQSDGWKQRGGASWGQPAEKSLSDGKFILLVVFTAEEQQWTIWWSSFQDSQEKCCSIEMVEEPEEKFRFRYKSEMQVSENWGAERMMIKAKCREPMVAFTEELTQRRTRLSQQCR